MRSDVFADDGIDARYRSASFASIGSLSRNWAWPAKAGGARRDRTDDLMLAKHALSQLSYGPVPEDECNALDQSGGPGKT